MSRRGIEWTILAFAVGLPLSYMIGVSTGRSAEQAEYHRLYVRLPQGCVNAITRIGADLSETDEGRGGALPDR